MNLPNIEFCLVSKDNFSEKIELSDLIVNATSIGMKDDVSPINLDLIKSHHTVYDLIYAKKTKLIEYAKNKAMNVANGIGMLINQGALAFNIWTGKDFQESKKLMREKIGNILNV